MCVDLIMCVCFVSLSECYGSSNGVKTERPEHGGLLNICCELSSLCFIVLQGGPSRLALRNIKHNDCQVIICIYHLTEGCMHFLYSPNIEWSDVKLPFCCSFP